MTDLETAVKNWADTTRLNTEQKLTRAFFLSLLNSSSIGGAFSGWLLAIAGATIGLMISSAEMVERTIGATGLKIALTLLILSCLCGFVVRLIAVYIDVYRNMIAELERSLEQILQLHDAEEEEIIKTAKGRVDTLDMEPDLTRVLANFLEALPRVTQWFVTRALSRGNEDPLYGYKRAVRLCIAQNAFVYPQVLLFAGFAIFVIAVI